LNNMKILLLVMFILVLPMAFADLTSIGFCSETLLCDLVSDGICPSVYDPVHRYCNDPDCAGYELTIDEIKICGTIFECGVNDSVCPTDFDTEDRICNTCDEDCQNCTTDCNLVSAEVDFYEGNGLYDLNENNLVDINDKVNLSVVVTGTECDIDEMKNLSIKVDGSEPCLTLTPSPSTSNLKKVGNNVYGNWTASYDCFCGDMDFTASTEDDAAVLEFNDGYTTQKDATGSFRTGVGPICSDEANLFGYIFNTTEGNPLGSATVLVRSDTETYEYITGLDGIYQINGIEPGEYLFTVSRYKFAPYVEYDLSYAGGTEYEKNVTLQPGMSDCEPDCTTTKNTICEIACDGWNGCSFYNQKTINICDGATNFHTKEYSETESVRCCEGAPFIKTNIGSSVSSSADNIITTTRIVILNGLPIKMNVVVVDKAN